MPENIAQWSQKAYAKINLALDVTGKRPDGYHEVSMIMQSVSLHDQLTFWPMESGISLTCNLPGLPCDSGNLAYRAVELLRRHCGINRGIRIHLEKRIPMAAGLAGGSSDAAAVLRGLNRLWELGLEPAELEQLAAQLGSDVPFCLWGGTVHATGRGEKLEALPDYAGLGVLLVHPAVEVSTAWVYGRFDWRAWSAERGGRHDLVEIRRAVAEKDFAALTGSLFNALETVTIPAHPLIAEIKSQLRQAGADGVLMSGSGPTVFALTPDRASAAAMARSLSLGPDVSIWVAETVAREEQINVPTIIAG